MCCNMNDDVNMNQNKFGRLFLFHFVSLRVGAVRTDHFRPLLPGFGTRATRQSLSQATERFNRLLLTFKTKMKSLLGLGSG